VSNKNEKLDHNKAKKVWKPVAAKEPAVRREPPPAKRPNLRHTPTATGKTNTPPTSEFLMPTKYEILLNMSDDEDEESQWKQRG
jgi:hypothetical protein